MQAAEIINALPTLEHDALREIINRAKFLDNPIGAEEGTAAPLSADEELVGTEMMEILRAVGDRLIPLPVFLKTKTGSRFRKGAKALLTYIEEGFHPKNKVERLKVIRFLLRLIARDMAKRGKPLSAPALVNHMTWISQIVERHFPGYLVNGLLPLLIRKTMSRR